MSAPSATPVTVDYMSNSFTATEGTDYTAVPLSTLTFAPGETTKEIEVQVAGDTHRELTERFSIRLSNPSGATLADATGKVAILDEEGPLTLSVSDVTVTEGDVGEVDLTFDITLDEAPDAGENVIVDVATDDGSAIAGEDYTALAPFTLTFASGETTKSVTVKGIGDVKPENDEYLLLNVNRPRNVVLADSQGKGWMVNDDD